MGTGKFYYHDMINDHVQWDPPAIGIFLSFDNISSVIVKTSKDSYILEMYNINGL